MLISALDLLSDDQAVTADAISTYVRDVLSSGGAINAGDTGGPTANTTVNLGAGTQLYLYVLVTTALASSGGTTSLITSLESDDNTSLSSATVHWTGSDIEEATLVAGYWIAKGMPLPQGAYQRYVGLRYNVGAEENFTSGKIKAWLSPVPYSDTVYESGTLTGVN
jgi:Bbp16